MLGRKIMQGLTLVLCFLCWDFYLKEAFYGWIVPKGEKAGLAEITMGYGLVFITAFVLSTLLCKRLGLTETEKESGEQY